MGAVTINKMLVATDFSEHSRSALRQALSLRTKLGGTVTVVHVLQDVRQALEELPQTSRWKLVAGNMDEFQKELRAKAETKLQAFIDQETKESLETQILLGNPYVELIHEIQRGGYGLLLSGTQGESAFRRFLVGSVAQRLIRNSPVPVWITRPSVTENPRSILVPVDFSAASQKSAEWACEIARRYSAQVFFLHVWELPSLSMMGLLTEGEDSAEERKKLLREFRRQAEERMESFAATLPRDIPIETAVTRGTPWKALVLAYRRLRPDLIVMGAVGRSGLSGFFLGNTAEKILRECPTSILSVKPDSFQTEIGPPLVQ